MLSKTVGIISIISFIWALVTGNLGAVGSSILESSGRAVTITLSLMGTMTFWSGIMSMLHEAGIIMIMSDLMLPITKLLFPVATKTGKGLEPAVACLAANFLGIGNAATPLGIQALREMQTYHNNSSNSERDFVATDDSMMLTVLCTASFSFIPTTVLTLRQAAGATIIFEILPKVWLCGSIGVTVSIISVKLCQRIFKYGQ